MSKFETDRYDLQRHSAVILQNSFYASLLKVNRFLMFLVITLMAVILVLGFFLFPKNELLDNLKKNQTAVDVHKVNMNPAISGEINTLKSQMIGLVSGSIESKLRSLEKSISTGKISSSDAGLIHDLKNDLKILQTYADPNAGKLVVSSGATQVIISELLLQEVSQLKMLIYLTIASCGLMVAGIGGVWLQNRYLIEHDKNLQKSAGYIPRE